MDSGKEFIFIDVRELHEYEEFNLGAKLIPLGSIMTAIEDLDDQKDQEIIVHCRSGARSGQAQQLMIHQFGFKNVRNLTGGVLAWIEAYGNKSLS